MSEENNDRTKEEIAADVKVKEAEVKLKEAEASKTEAEASKARFEAHEAELKYYAAREKFDREKAEDERNLLYRFTGDVSAGSVSRCMKKLTEWSRVSPGCDMEIVFSSPERKHY